MSPQFRNCLRCTRGNRDEETDCCRTDRRVIFFVPGKSPGTCWKCGFGRGVGRGRSRTCGRGGRCAHWIYGGARNRAFLGSWAFGVAIPRPARTTSHAWSPRTNWNPGATNSSTRNSRDWNAGASGRQNKSATGGKNSRDACRHKSRAARSRI